MIDINCNNLGIKQIQLILNNYVGRKAIVYSEDSWYNNYVTYGYGNLDTYKIVGININQNGLDQIRKIFNKEQLLKIYVV